MTPKTVLKKAAEVISKKGWVRGSARDPESGAVCMLGAIWGVCYPGFLKGRGLEGADYGRQNKSASDAEGQLVAYLGRLYPNNATLTVPVANDDVVTSGTEAACLLLEAAEYKP